MARNGQRDQQIGHVGGRERALRRREAAVRSIAAPGRAILRVFRCVIANVRAILLRHLSAGPVGHLLVGRCGRCAAQQLRVCVCLPCFLGGSHTQCVCVCVCVCSCV